MLRRIFPVWILLPALALAFPSRLPGGELHVDKAAANRVAFTARFMGETFQGTTGKIDGYVAWNGADPDSGGVEGSDLYFEVDLNSLDTGIGMRNNHMRENYLITDTYPYAAYKGKIVKAARPGGSEMLVDVDGVMTIHGTGKPLRVTGRVRVDGDRYRLTCSFPLDIRDFGIEVPSLMGMKVGPVVQLDMDVMLVQVN